MAVELRALERTIK